MSQGNADPIHSEFASDAEMRELIQMFVEEIPARVEEFEQAWKHANLTAIKHFAHQLKGAAPGYGFASMGSAAADVESAVRASADLSTIRAELDQLIDLCNRASL